MRSIPPANMPSGFKPKTQQLYVREEKHQMQRHLSGAVMTEIAQSEYMKKSIWAGTTDGVGQP